MRTVAKGPRGEAALSHLDKAVADIDRGHPGKAVEDAEQAKSLAPRSPTAREVLAIAYYGAERFKDAIPEVQAYRRLSGRTDQNHIEADSLRALGQSERALDLVRDELRDREVDQEARAEAAIVGASILAEDGRIDAALALLRRVKTRQDVGRAWDMRVWYVTGDILARAGRSEEAAEEFHRILRFDADSFDVAERLAAL